MARAQMTDREQEDRLQQDVADFLRRAMPPGLPWWHTPNGGKREHVERVDRRTGKTYRYSPEGAKLQRMGVRAGVPDLVFIMPNGQAAFIELKVGDNTLSDDQDVLKAELVGCRCGYVLARSLDEVETTLSRWLDAYGLRLRATLGRRAA